MLLAGLGGVGLWWFLGNSQSGATAARKSDARSGGLLDGKPRGKKRGVIDLSKDDAWNRGSGNINLSRVRKTLAKEGWVAGQITTNFEGSFTSKRFAINRNDEKGEVTLSRFDDEDDAKKKELFSRQQSGSATLRRGSAVLQIWVHEDGSEAQRLVQVVKGAAKR